MRSTRIRTTGTALLVGGALLLATACSSAGSGGGGEKKADAGSTSAAASAAPSAAAPAAPKASAAVLTVQPQDGAQNVAPSGALKVSVSNGKLTQVTVAGPDGKAVDGAVAADGSWVPSGGLTVGKQYRVSARAVDADGVATSTSTSFSTLTPAHTAHVVDNLGDKQTYGVGMIISVEFTQPVSNKKAVEQAIAVQASDDTQVKGHWFGDKRLDLRPENYWKPGTTVTVHRRTTGVELSPGVYGDSDLDESFTVGRSKISTADAATHRMTVVKDGAAPQVIAITAGDNLNPSWNGTMVVFERKRMEHMDSTTTDIKGAGYTADEPHALKITTTGSYVHGNPKAVTFAGHENISHGCIGLPDTPEGDDSSVAGKFYADSMIGDVVIVKNSVGEKVHPDNGLSGWSLPWSAW
ncbi:L,D-transpeptidase [Kitasatospora azatica]|uniref:L,D-transpeptidase n=1 Tax=Kitasatospora azatica TaxID=58347 RepID=UPI00068B56B7|nr:Ig-like domain-containing protein [Kitasatospora azatica]